MQAFGFTVSQTWMGTALSTPVLHIERSAQIFQGVALSGADGSTFWHTADSETTYLASQGKLRWRWEGRYRNRGTLCTWPCESIRVWPFEMATSHVTKVRDLAQYDLGHGVTRGDQI